MYKDCKPLVEELKSRIGDWRVGFDFSTKITDLFVVSRWLWPDSWATKYSMFLNTQPPNPTKDDMIMWRSYNGNLCDFSVSEVWDTIRPRTATVNCISLVWFSQSIPPQSFLMWLLIKEKLKTQDKLRPWRLRMVMWVVARYVVINKTIKRIFSFSIHIPRKSGSS
ncbi:uncharacterized protein [Rutidosis leptorrhynchoides]|uniref:uncharacterized protein n=1 Tax=Rutidosis leptorrhynchoides TaxID=125765 RepID=UPI003A9915DC